MNDALAFGRERCGLRRLGAVTPVAFNESGILQALLVTVAAAIDQNRHPTDVRAIHAFIGEAMDVANTHEVLLYPEEGAAVTGVV